ncbi:hypothetical protein GCM10012290_22450 [Halolactibacillus alkaliphilus]|uniref:Uncharacterized protein n=1 Tax=Halolactibacillus alkaliphilus TaxID=442899 RepID=A0A511X407_9BACI|nr:DUF58 domain-containing protein [Halolactibacillus alkaliphilus]GEN57645.1 hypothetical protein HAL01_21090 [Halolactibacillus alkaliphilus]GGN74509.1 hypothetical protein GCM10012290_22450 [Halolactibacillus alkaliphilus]SFP02049.1 Uncharacterized conserved protein, DUF58 family, contains vWF domain [Halolactibacillus alkaliphilus]
MNLAWLIIFVVSFIYCQSYFFLKFGFKGLTYERTFNKQTAFPNEKIEIIDEITNKKILPLPWVSVEAKLSKYLVSVIDERIPDEDPFHQTLFSLLPYQRIKRRHHMIVKKRGVYQLASVALTLGDMFGFSDHYQSHETAARLVVYPMLMRKSDLPEDVQFFLGEHAVNRWIIEDPFLKIGTRDYVEGDGSHKINWKQTAKRQVLQVNEHDHTRERDLTILLNIDQADDIWLPIEDDDLFENSLSVIASVFYDLKLQGAPFRFLTNAVTKDKRDPAINDFVSVEKGQGHRHYIEGLTKLSYLIPERKHHFKYVLENVAKEPGIGETYVIFTPIVTPILKVQVDQLKKQGKRISIIPLRKKKVMHNA